MARDARHRSLAFRRVPRAGAPDMENIQQPRRMKSGLRDQIEIRMLRATDAQAVPATIEWAGLVAADIRPRRTGRRHFPLLPELCGFIAAREHRRVHDRIKNMTELRCTVETASIGNRLRRGQRHLRIIGKIEHRVGHLRLVTAPRRPGADGRVVPAIRPLGGKHARVNFGFGRGVILVNIKADVPAVRADIFRIGVLVERCGPQIMRHPRIAHVVIHHRIVVINMAWQSRLSDSFLLSRDEAARDDAVLLRVDQAGLTYNSIRPLQHFSVPHQ